MTSTSGSTGAGLKKCIPTTRSGVRVADAISLTERADVFVARIASGATIPSSSPKSSRLTSRSSNAASITSWQEARSASSVTSVSRPRAASLSSWVSRSFSTPRER